MRSAEKCAKKHRVFAKEKYVFFIQRRSTVVYLLREEAVQSAECKKQGCAFVQGKEEAALFSPHQHSAVKIPHSAVKTLSALHYSSTALHCTAVSAVNNNKATQLLTTTFF